ncbi:MAG: recombinase family protein, partial [bacterium]
MKVIGYARVSTEEQAREGVSLDNQRRKIELYAEMNDMELIGIEIDEGISAKNLKRPGVQRVLELARKKQVDCIIIYKLDRMFRNTVDALNTSQMLDKQGVALHSINERLDTKSAIGKFFFSLTASLAEMERNVISERTVDSMKHMKESGKCVGNVCFGFRRSSDGIHVEPEPIEQEILVRIRELREAGFTLDAIATELTVLGFVTRGGGNWKKQ